MWSRPASRVLFVVMPKRCSRRSLAGAATTGVLFAGIVAGSPAAGSVSRAVTVPNVIGLDLNHAYARLRRLGLRVSFPTRFSEGAFTCFPIISRQSPRPGRSLSNSATVTLAAQPPTCGAESPAVPVGRLPSAIVPSFVGRPVTTAVDWADKHHLYWHAERLPPLRSANGANLLANYRVAAQSPRAGARLSLGVGTRHGNTGTFRPTPLILHAQLATRA
jgi:hypothetical protein